MIEIYVDIETKVDHDLGREISNLRFSNFDEFIVFVMAELDPSEEKVYILGYGGDEDGVVFIDHLTGNIIDNLLTQFKHQYEVCSSLGGKEYVHLYAQENYNDAYKLAIDMKESTGMLDFQLKDEETPTVKNGGIEVTSLKN